MAENLDTLGYRMTRLEAELANAEREIEALESQLHALKDDAANRERSQLKAGVIFLGGLIFTLFGVIWANLGQIMPGR